MLRIASKYHNKKNNPMEHTLLKKIMALAYLPYKKIREGLHFIEKEVIRLVTDSKRLRAWTKMLEYFEQEWMKVVKPKNFSVFNALDRTDNNAESYHRDLNREMGSKPTCPHFLGKKCILGFFAENEKSLHFKATEFSCRLITNFVCKNDEKI